MPQDDRPEDLGQQLTALAREVARLREDVDALQAPSSPGAVSGESPFWALEALRALSGDDDNGAVLFAGTTTPPGMEGPIEWQWARSGDDLAASDWAVAATRLSALAHPVRIAILQAIYQGRDSAADLASGDDFGTSGQIYHHISQLTAAGWLTSSRRGHYMVPPDKVIPLLTLISAAS